MEVQDIKVRKILNSRGLWALELDLKVDEKWSRVSVPAGLSRGKNEAAQFEVSKSMELLPKFKSQVVGAYADQETLDKQLQKISGPQKKKFGVDLVLATSIAALKAQGTIYKTIAKLAETKSAMPTPMLNIINGGLHAGNNLAIQEFMIVPHRFGTFAEKIEAAAEIYQRLRENLKAKYGRAAVNIGDEGGFAPPMETTVDAIEAIQAVLDELGHSKSVGIALDCAASSYFENKKYVIDGKALTTNNYIEHLKEICTKYSLFSVEDPIQEDDFAGWTNFTKEVNCIVVGDDLLVTNPKRVDEAMKKKACDAVLVKPNQIGTVTETLKVIDMARKAGWKYIISHRSGETNSDFIAHLAVGSEAPLIKAGAPARGERVAKYNRLLRLEKVIS
ncbi:MAG: phosphopyruvate hydratase [Candidatus Altiarchaeota archaeon]|nr:phosphopyruvate hydratase [Candidatus Altiarchaeota archaeon]